MNWIADLAYLLASRPVRNMLSPHALIVNVLLERAIVGTVPMNVNVTNLVVLGGKNV